MKNHITVESFGSEVPMNWEEIAAYLNNLIDEKIEASGMDPDPVSGSEEARDLHDLIDSIWNAYWNGEYNDAPAARTGEEDKMEIGFYAGESRHSADGVNYLLGGNFDADEYIYAEAVLPDGDHSDDYGYLTMKAALVKALRQAGIDTSRFSFHYDGQEQYLEQDASADCEVRIKFRVRRTVYRVYTNDAEMKYVNGKAPELTQDSIEEALFGEGSDPIMDKEFTTKEEAVAYLRQRYPEMDVGPASGMGVKYIPVSGAEVVEMTVLVTEYGIEDSDYCGCWATSNYRPMVENASGSIVDFEAAVPLMDESIRERLNAQLAPCSPQEFFTAYEEAHEKKYGEEWELSKYNPVF